MESLSPDYNHLIQKIDGFIRKYYLNRIIRGSIYLSTLFLAGYLIVTLAEYYGNFTPIIRTLLFYSFVTLNGLIAIIYIFKPCFSYFQLGKSISHEKAAEIIGLHFLPIKDKLLNTLQLKKLSETNPEQKKLIEASISQKITELKPIPFSAAIKFSANKPYLKYLLVPLLVILFIAFKSPYIFEESTTRLINHDQQFIKKAPFRFVVLNKNLDVAQGDDYTLKLKLEGNEIPSEFFIEIGENVFKMEQENVVSFSYTFKNIQNNKEFISLVYPTLTASNLNFTTGGATGVKQMTVQVTDLQGRQLQQKVFAFKNGQVSLGNLPAGMYLIKFTSDNRRYTHLQKIVKQ